MPDGEQRWQRGRNPSYGVGQTQFYRQVPLPLVVESFDVAPPFFFYSDSELPLNGNTLNDRSGLA